MLTAACGEGLICLYDHLIITEDNAEVTQEYRGLLTDVSNLTQSFEIIFAFMQLIWQVT
jgi:hypothetical protein